jgi:hypothetical protein
VPKFQSAKVAKCQSCKAPKMQSAKVAKCQSCKVPKLQSAKVAKGQSFEVPMVQSAKAATTKVQSAKVWAPNLFYPNFYVLYLKPHVKFRNPTIIPSVRKVTTADREKNGHLAARANLSKIRSALKFVDTHREII